MKEITVTMWRKRASVNFNELSLVQVTEISISILKTPFSSILCLDIDQKIFAALVDF